MPLDALVAVLLAAAVAVVLRFTRPWPTPGTRSAMRPSPRASRAFGVRMLSGLAYVVCGTLAGVAGVLVAARTGSSAHRSASGLEFFAIAVVALGAGGLPPGRASVVHALVGTLILMMVFNYMTIRGVPGTWQTTVTGLLLLAAMVGGRLIQRDGRDIAAGEAFRDEYSEMGLGAARLARGAMAVATIVLALAFAIINPRFATLPNLVAMLEQNAALAIVAVGAMIGIVSRSVDISPGSVVALGAVLAALSAQARPACAARPPRRHARLRRRLPPQRDHRRRPRPRPPDRHARRLDLGARPCRVAHQCEHDPLRRRLRLADERAARPRPQPERAPHRGSPSRSAG